MYPKFTMFRSYSQHIKCIMSHMEESIPMSGKTKNCGVYMFMGPHAAANITSKLIAWCSTCGPNLDMSKSRTICLRGGEGLGTLPKKEGLSQAITATGVVLYIRH